MFKRALGTFASLAFVASVGTAAFAADTAIDGTVAPNAMSDSMHKDPMVGGAAMYPEKNIVENAVNSKDHTTLVAAVKAAGLVSVLEGPGPFTVFAPTNEAFDKLPEGTVPTLLKPENKEKLTKVLTYHVVAGTFDAEAIKAKIKAGHGSTKLKTVEGDELTIKEAKGGALEITDSHKDVAMVTIADVYQKNGIIHVINKVLLP